MTICKQLQSISSSSSMITDESLAYFQNHVSQVSDN